MKMVNFWENHYFSFHAWEQWVCQAEKTISSSLNGRCELETRCLLLLLLAGEGAVSELQTAASRKEFNQGWCQDLAEKWHISCKTMILTQKAVFRFQHGNCQGQLGHRSAEYVLCCMRRRLICCSTTVPPWVAWGWEAFTCSPRVKDQDTSALTGLSEAMQKK